MLELTLIEVAGTPRAMGRAHGEALREAVRGFIADRLRAGRQYLRDEHCGGDLVATAAVCLEIWRGWDPAGWDEHHGVAEGAGVDPAELHAAGNLTDIRDVAAMRPAPVGTSEGCTMTLVPAARSATAAPLAGQTWDLNPADLEFVVAIHRRPDDGPATVSVTCAGCPNLMGLNRHGLAFGTTNIKVHGVRPGVAYLPLLHRISRCRDRAEAAAVIRSAPRAAAHNYWLADPGGVEDWECTATTANRRDGGTALARTNHCLRPENLAAQATAPPASTLARLARAQAGLAEGRIGVADLRRLFADRSDGIDSISRHPEDGTGTTTNACVIAEPARGILHACRGPSARGRWIELSP